MCKVLVWEIASIDMAGTVEVLLPFMTLADVNITVVTDMGIVLLARVVIGTSIDALAARIIGWFLNGIGVDVLAESTLSLFVANMTALEFSFPMPSKEFSSSATIDS